MPFSRTCERVNAAMERVEWEDVQGIVLSGYGKLRHSAYLLWRFDRKDSEAEKRWLASLAGRLTRTDAAEEEDVPTVKPRAAPQARLKASKQAAEGHQPAINLALTARGLERVGIGTPALDGFSAEFLEGMSPEPGAREEVPRRSNVLGDLERSSPRCWNWGGWRTNRDIDGLLLLFAADDPSLDRLVAAETKAMAGAAQPLPVVLRGRIHDDFKEHFGYLDGISQPIIEGEPEWSRRKPPTAKQEDISRVKPGEFLLGYLNERRVRVGERPHAKGAKPTTARDIRRNGTYLVFRQLEQDVAAFDDFVSRQAQGLRETKDWIRARLIGRTPEGGPLIPDLANASENKNEFLYYHQDRFGLTCPIGAHIRRANPRDSLNPDPETALRLSKMHRIIRRGRPYGERWKPTKDKADSEAHRGMLFIALNADIAGQFEMIQNSWLNNPHFAGQYAGTDPLSHVVAGGDLITIQRRPINIRINRPEPFVRVRGGAYFFLPGIQALRTMAS
jgi:Dyp-type peroxidase family